MTPHPKRLSIHFHALLPNINFLAAIVVTTGCSVLVVNAVLSFLPYISSNFRSPNGVIYIEGILSCLSNILFLVGSASAVVQVVRANRWANSNSGETWTSESKIDSSDSDAEKGIQPTKDQSDPPPAYLEDPSKEESIDSSKVETTASDWETRDDVPGPHDEWLRNIHELGFLATLIFLCSSTLYFTTSIASIVTIIRIGEISKWIRYPQLVAAVGFTVASGMMMYQAQETWWRPAFKDLRWLISLFNLVGSVGFIICASCGLMDDEWAHYQFGVSYLWGSWAFLFASITQWYRSLARRTVDKEKDYG